MQTQRVFQAGNSQVVAIPKDFGFRVGHKVVVEKTPDGVFIRRAEGAKKSSKAKSEAEFQSWLNVFIKENGEILDELAVR